MGHGGGGEAGLAPDVLHEALSRAIARHCPGWLVDQREDLVQAAAVRVLETERRSGGAAVRTATYAWKVAYSVVVDEIRRRRRSREVPVEPWHDRPAADSVSPEHGIAERECGRALRDCLQALAAPRRIAVMLHLQGHRLDDGAALSGWGSKRYTNLVYRGLADLRRCLLQKGLTR